MKEEPLPKGSLWDKTLRTRRKIVEIGEKQKHHFRLGDLGGFAVFFFNGLLHRHVEDQEEQSTEEMWE